jgi:hypothetical protein
MRSARGATGPTAQLAPRQRTEWHAPAAAEGDADADGLFHWLGTNGGVGRARSSHF